MLCRRAARCMLSALHRASNGHRVNSHLHELIGLISLHAEWAYAAIFLAAFLEAVPLLGSLIPGSTIILALSALVPGGSLMLGPVLTAAIAGALLGDGLAYFVGRKNERRVLTSWPMSKYPALVAQSEAFFHRYGTLAVLFARFVPPVRAVVPITAGALGMPPQRFYPVNAAAILLWAPAHILPGVLAGSAAEQWGMKIEHYGVPLVAGIIVIGCAGWAIYHCREWRKSRCIRRDFR
ncbi:DedA family protein [soil metagenome]